MAQIIALPLPSMSCRNLVAGLKGAESILTLAVRRWIIRFRSGGLSPGLMLVGDTELADRVLRTTLLSVPGAEFALGPLQDLGALMLGARLLLSRRGCDGDSQAQKRSRTARCRTEPGGA